MTEPGPAGQIELSILVVNWNTRDLTCACLEAIPASAARTRHETILVDNGSADGSAAAIGARFPEVLLLAEPVNHGFAVANNIAATRARGDYLLLLNSDTIPLPGAIDALMEFAHSRPEARIWGGRTIFADGRLNPQSAWGRITLWSTFCFAVGLTRLFPNSPLFNPEGLGGWDRSIERPVDIVSGCYFLIERRLWEQLGGFDPKFFMYGEEADLCFRATEFGASPRVCATSTIVHHGGGSTTIGDMTSYVSGAKIELARRSMSPASAAATRFLLLAAVCVRSFAFGLFAPLVPRLRPQARLWRGIWRQRRLWQEGPVAAGALDKPATR